MDEHALVVEGLIASYGRTTILDACELSVPASGVLGLIGRNGVGKTTFARSVVGLTPPAVRSERIEFRGTDIRRLSTERRAREGIAYVPQGRRLFSSLTVTENLTLGRRNGRRADWTISRVMNLFPQLNRMRERPAGVLSGGEQQMVAIGRALMRNPSLLIMDEPSEGLAPVVVEQLADSLLRLRDSGISLLLIEQNLSVVMKVAGAVALMSLGGRVVVMDPPDLQGSPEFQREFFGARTG